MVVIPRFSSLFGSPSSSRPESGKGCPPISLYVEVHGGMAHGPPVHDPRVILDLRLAMMRLENVDAC